MLAKLNKIDNREYNAGLGWIFKFIIFSGREKNVELFGNKKNICNVTQLKKSLKVIL
jgi:hypothetical protein